MLVYVTEDEQYPVYTIKVTADETGSVAVDLSVDAETVARWQAAQAAWLKANAEIGALMEAHYDALKKVPVDTGPSAQELEEVFPEKG